MIPLSRHKHGKHGDQTICLHWYFNYLYYQKLWILTCLGGQKQLMKLLEVLTAEQVN